VTDDFEKKYSFSIVRNPWDRIASAYRFVVHKHPYKLFRTQPKLKDPEYRRKELRRCREDFDYWLMDYCEKWAYWPQGLKRLGQPFTTASQHYWLFDDLGNQMVDQVWRFEDMAAMWAHLGEHFGVRELRVNVTTEPGGRRYRPYYSEKSRDYIGEHFRDDIERWGYEF